MVKSKGPSVLALVAGIIGIVLTVVGILAVAFLGSFFGDLSAIPGLENISGLVGLALVGAIVLLALNIAVVIFSRWMKDDAKAKKGSIIVLIIGAMMIFPLGLWIIGGLTLAAGIWGLVVNK